ncbi:MAG: methyltransferase domain-containing protein, partial [Thermomicrobiales bacterium]|nr:methyltransferase domain-containing protein [Thermomicrobiales bacterium]
IHQLAIEAPAQRHELERSGGDRLSRNADRLRALRPDLMATIDRVEAGILDGFAAIGEAPGAPIHGDLKPAHVLLTEDASTFLDLDKFAVGEPMLDVTSLARHILRGRSTNPGLTPQDLAAAFVTEYFAHSPSDWQTRFGPHYAATLIGEASAAGRSVRGNREHAAGKPRARPTKDVERLLEEALEALSGQAPWAASISDADADATPPLASAAAVEPGAASPDAQSAGGGDRGAAGAARQSGAGKRRAANAAIFAHLADSPDIASLFAAYPDLTLDDLRSAFGEAEALTRQSRTINFRKGVTQTSFTRTHGLPEPDLSVHKGNVFRALISLLKPGRMLDLGAGKGNFSLSAAELGWRVTAVDARTVRWPDLNAESDPERAALLQSIRWVQADVREFPIARGDFDLICILGLLHHLEVADQVELLKRCSGAPLLLDTRIAKSNVDHVDGYEGMLIQEHGQTREERDAVPQASWGNPVSFQHTEESLTKLVQDCGYMKIFQMRPPHRPDYTFYLCLPSGMDRKRLDRRAERRALREEGKSGYAPTDPRSAGLSGSGEPAPKGKRRRKSAES